ncbi:MAG: YitT family protein [Oscillospiraceae bacterium]|nr:YitT family protein [Oscillospiraceae bacterium]
MKKEKQRMTAAMKRRAVLRWIIDLAIILFGSALYALGVHSFVSPNNIAPGGVTGIAVVLTSLLPVKVGTLILAFNIPLIILGFIFLNKSTMIKTLISVAAVTFFTDYLGQYVPTYSAEGGNGIVAALFGGALMGIGLGLNYQREGTTGGTDIVTKIIQRFHPDMKLSVITGALDILVVCFGMLVYKDINVVLFAVVAIFVQSKVIDFIVYGTQESRFLMIFSEHSKEIAKKLLEQGRGVTLFKAEGAYSGDERQVIATAVHRTAYSKVKRLVRETDPQAFVVMTSAAEVFGQGFTKLV